MVYHVINRGVGKKKLFFKDEDYLAFERVIVETLEKRLMRILSYCLIWDKTGTGPVVDKMGTFGIVLQCPEQPATLPEEWSTT